jgi:predicted phosphodiesterase
MNCPECKSSHIKRKGIRNEKQRFYCHECGKYWQDCPTKRTNGDILRQLSNRFSDEELRAIAKGRGLNPHSVDRPLINFEGEEVTVGFCTDTHIGEMSFNDSLWEAFIHECRKENVRLILHAGDLVEGMSNRPDQIYHLDDIGISKQMDHAQRLLDYSPIPIYGISGNHDRWQIKSNGLFVLPDLEKRCDRFKYIGSDFGSITINGTEWMLWHGEDASSYATSYRVQKLVEAFTGGDKPHVLLCGHTHKQGYFFDRNVHCVTGGALSYQSAWMKATRKACHTGFHIIKARIADNEIKRFSVTWYPFYR